MLLHKELLSPDELYHGVNSFRGVRRRLELLSPCSTTPVYEGFGSSYEKAKSAIAALKLHFPDRRLIVVFEPHTFTWRNREAIAAYDDVFEGAAKIFIYQPAAQGADTHAQLTQEEILARVRSARYDADAIVDTNDALKKIGGLLQPADIVLLLTSGELGGLISAIPTLVEQTFPSTRQ
jgi:UDP-N-acetylmuramate: L-alanyl-gamma-D-glutamyl-meso-diaminopimelate ligase